MDDSLGQPEYRRVMDDLRRKIVAGDIEVGNPIPSTSKLMEQYSVSSTVVRRAVSELRGEGLLHGHSGKAVFVRAKPETAQNEQATLELLNQGFEKLAQRVDEMDSTNKDLATTLRAELSDLKDLVAALQTQLIELYGRTGQPYPHDALPTSAGTTGAGGNRAVGA
ncbi:GntR family transcriptional regulator [Streptomyces sp. BE147]|uniref:GntR family transcriptional regulator n=1 Tax=Streptomyces sp. BE147 TaxID=3002524 RepID=UPI002E7AA53B|nr:GntR family transcriptional regulator [Streptomyces sp. BE147]MEE1741192.1 GntR family transcriptional regulator [Streptomyces sp. BE147]